MKIEWELFFGGGNSTTYQCYYKAEINGVRVEKMTHTKAADRFSIGNMDYAKKKYKSEKDLLEALEEKEKEAIENADGGSPPGIS